MSEVSSTADRSGAHRLWLAAAVVAALAVAGAVGLLYAKRRNVVEIPEPAAAQIVHKGPFARFAVGSIGRLQTWPAPRTPPALGFKDVQARPLKLADYRGKVVVMNVWAHWCAPCRIEMPTLAELQRHYQGADLVVVPVSIDKPKDYENAKNFLDLDNPLPLLFDRGDIPSTLRLRGFPSTMIYDRDGHEVARLEGEATWNTPEAYAFFDALLRRK